MRSLIWKELRENFRCAALALLPISALAYATVSHPNALTMISPNYLFLTSVVAAAFGCTLGFMQVFAESGGDGRALLVHRPLSTTRIFAAKVLAGLGLYVPVVGLPFAAAVLWNAMPGHGASPFRWPLALPWLADILTGIVYYFAAMLAAQRNTPWYGSRGLGLATAFACSVMVHLVPEFGYALAVIMAMGALLAVAARGSFVSGGRDCPRGSVAKIALALTLLIGLLVTGTAAVNLPILALEILGPDNRSVWYEVDRQGRVLIVRQDKRGEIESVTDLAGNNSTGPRGKRLDQRTIEEITTRLRLLHREPDVAGYRSYNRVFVPIENDSSSIAELWYYVQDQALLMGYEQRSKRLVGSLGPNGFTPSHGQPAERFHGPLFLPYGNRGNDSPDYLTFPGNVYTVDFNQRTIQCLFSPPAGETILTAHRFEDRQQKRSLTMILSDTSIHVVDDAGQRVFSAPLVYGLGQFTNVRAGQLEGGQGYVVWYGRASWWSRRPSADRAPSHLVQYNAGGREVARQTLPALPFAEFSPGQAMMGLVTPLAGYVLRGCVAETWEHREAWSLGMEGSTFAGFTALMLLSATVCAVANSLLARRYAFSASHRLSLSLCGILFGPAGLLLMLAFHEFPALVVCHRCRRPRVVTRDQCEHCGIGHAPPAPDGTEIFETTIEAAGPIRDPVYLTATGDGEAPK